jgi:hypothetical protein
VITPAVEQREEIGETAAETSSLSEKCAGKSLMATILSVSVSVSYKRYTSPRPRNSIWR